MNNKLQNILNQQIDEFLKAIQKEVSIDSLKVHSVKPDYPIFMPDSNYYEQKYYQGVLESCIREYLITGIITKWLRAIGKRCYILKYKGKRQGDRSNYSNETYGEKYPFVFIVEDNGYRIGYRYSYIENFSSRSYDRRFFQYNSDLRILSLFMKYKVNEIKIIDWKDSVTSSKNSLGSRNETLKKFVKWITIREFLNQYFTNDQSSLYINEIRNAITIALNEIGYQTISDLSLKHLSDFRDELITKIYSFDIRTARYNEFSKEGELTGNQFELLDDSDYNIIINRCYTENLIRVLAGKNKFARCFMTSEHLYETFKSDNQNYYDYSTVVSGYFKSVELLLEEAMLATFTHSWHENLWITGYPPKDFDSTECKVVRNGRKTYKHIKFKEEYKNLFSNEMGSLILFLYDNTEGWFIQPNGIRKVKKCLINYIQGCRNEHLHKDIIDDMKTVESIRTNTILCLLYLLGGYRFYSSPVEDYERLGGDDKGYNKLYKTIKQMRFAADRFIIETNNGTEFKAIRLFDEPPTEYDQLGNIITGINFAVVDTFCIDDYEKYILELPAEQRLTITKDNMPRRIWWCTTHNGEEEQRHEIEW